MARRKIGLTAYGFNIKDDANNRLELNDFCHTKKSFLEIYKNYLSGIMNVIDNDSNNERLFFYEKAEIESVINDSGNILYSIMYGRVKTGEYGTESEIYDSVTGIRTHLKRDKEADIMPFGFAIIIPAGIMDNGIILLQSISKNGIKLALHKRLDNFVKKLNTNYRFNMGIIVPKVMLDRFLNNGVLEKIRMIRHDVPKDLAERYGLNAGVKDVVEERVIKHPKGFLKNKNKEIEAWRKGEISYDELIQIDDFEYDDLMMEFKLGSTTKTLSLRNIENLQICEDITKDVTMEGGHPEFESLKKEMKLIAEFYLKAKGLLIDE